MRKFLHFFLTLYFILGLHGEIVAAGDKPSNKSVDLSPSSSASQPPEEEVDSKTRGASSDSALSSSSSSSLVSPILSPLSSSSSSSSSSSDASSLPLPPPSGGKKRARSSEDGPPFYLIRTSDGKSIYILGAIHPVGIDKALSPAAQKELKNIVALDPIFLTEHSIINKTALAKLSQAIAENKNEDAEQSWYEELNPRFKKIFDSEGKDLIGMMEGKPTIDAFKLLLTEQAYLVFPILVEYRGALHRKHFTTFEDSVITAFKSLKEKEQYLESDQEALDALQSENPLKIVGWISGALNGIETLKKCTDILTKQALEKQFLLLRDDYTYIIYKTPDVTDVSMIRRNKVWVNKMKAIYAQNDNFLVIVGQDHLKGPNGFLNLLIKELQLQVKTPILSRLDDNEWEVLS